MKKSEKFFSSWPSLSCFSILKALVTRVRSNDGMHFKETDLITWPMYDSKNELIEKKDYQSLINNIRSQKESQLHF